jgi:hypothetical protein
MIERDASSKDIPNIVALQKLSLGESLMPKSEMLWCWKHVNNPFGESRVLISEENEKLVGLRAFMNWEWTESDTIIRSLRAVDTATHPQYQGKGIFKRLTLRLVSENKQAVSFIFNTPNKKSAAGYLKMGWFSYKRMAIRIKICPLNLIKKPRVHKDQLKNFLVENILDNIQPDELIAWKTTAITSNITKEYLQWRYVDIPGIAYYGIIDRTRKSFLIIFRVKTSTSGNSELRICDVLCGKNIEPKLLRQQLRVIIKLVQPGFVSIAKGLTKDLNKILNRLLFLPALPIGPQITIRSMNREMNEQFLNQHWRPSIGDIEIF